MNPVLGEVHVVASSIVSRPARRMHFRVFRVLTSGHFSVQVRSENSVVLLCRDTAPSAPGLRELSLDLALWQPLIEDRAFVPWLVRQPSEQVTWPCARQPCWLRPLTCGDITSTRTGGWRHGHERSSDCLAESAAAGENLPGSATSVLATCRRWRARGT